MRKILMILSTLLTLFLCFGNSIAQEDSLRVMKRWQLKGYVESALRLGDSYQAKAFLEEWHRREPKNDQVTLQLGRMCYKVRDYVQTEKIFTQLYAKDPKQNLQALYYLSLVQMHHGKYSDALEKFEALKRRYRKIAEPGVDRLEIERLIEGCEMGMNLNTYAPSVEVTQLDSSINTHYSERGFVLINDHEFVYSSVQPKSRNFHELNRPYKSVRGFYKANKVNNHWSGQEEVTPPFFNYDEFDTGQGVFSMDKKRFYLTLCAMNSEGDNICQIYVSHLKSHGEWSQPVALGKEVNHPSFTTAHPTVGSCFDNSLEIIYFVSDRPGGAGGMDIWFTAYNKRQKTYTDAANAGVFINTSGDELSPFYDLSSHRLYFSSDGLPGYGGLDVFYSEGEMVTWQEPVNVGLPINSSYDELNFVRNYSGKFGLFVSNRPGSRALFHQGCCDDVYSFYDTQTSKVLITGKLLRSEESVLDNNVQGQSKSIGPLDVVKDKLITVEMKREFLSPLYLQGVETNAEGEFELWVEPGYDYTVNVQDSTLLDRSFTLSTQGMKEDETKVLDVIPLVGIPQVPIALKNIYYQFDEDELTSQARSILDSTLLKIMNLYPHLFVEIAAHTDAVGDDEYNLILSEKRARNIVKYLVKKGIPAERLTSIGFGASQPIAPNYHPDGSDNPDGRQQNRRTEFRIIGLSDW